VFGIYLLVQESEFVVVFGKEVSNFLVAFLFERDDQVLHFV